MEDAVQELSSALLREELSSAIESSLCSLFASSVVVFQSGYECGENLECTNVCARVGDSKLPLKGVASECYEGGSYVLKRWRELVDESDPLVQFLPESVGSDEAVVICLSMEAPIELQINLGNSMELVIAMLCEKPLSADEDKQMNQLRKHIQSALVRVLKYTSLLTERDSLNGMLKMCSELIDQNAALLTKKILGHLKRETGCGCCTLLVIDKQTEEFVCQVFNVEELDQEYRFPLEGCLYGHVANTGQIINIPDVSSQTSFPKFVSERDVIFDYFPQSLLCMPVYSKTDPSFVMAVAVVYDKRSRSRFTVRDETKMAFVLRFCSSVLHNTLSYQRERYLKSQTMALLDVVEVLFVHMDNMDLLLQKIMEQAQNIANAERCSLFLIDYDAQELVAKIFDSTVSDNDQPSTEIRFPLTQGIAGYVATTGDVLNIRDAYTHPLFYKDVDLSTGFTTRNILCFPIKNEDGQTVGVAELCNKIDGDYFTHEDVNLAVQFSAYCAISIHQSMLYKEVTEAQHRSRLANELMLYHMQVEESEVKSVSTEKIQAPEEVGTMFHRCSFLPRSIVEDETSSACMTMFQDMGLIKQWRIPTDVLARFLLMVKHGYRNPPYHNWMHAFSVGHFCYALYKTCNDFEFLKNLEILSLMVATLCHDLDHRGTNNAFQVSAKSPIAALYSSEGSVMERHHFSQTLCILNADGCNIFQNLSHAQYSEVLDLIRDAILATDLSHHLRIVSHLEAMCEVGYNIRSSEHRHLMMCLLMTSCDLCACTKTWHAAKSVADLIYAEFFSQGDLERALGVQPLEMMDRERACIPELQLNFLDFIVIPAYRLLGRLLPETSDVLERTLDGRERWRLMTEEIKREKGLSVLNSTAKKQAEKVRRTSIRNRPSRSSLTRENSLPESLPEESHKDDDDDKELSMSMGKMSSASDPGPSSVSSPHLQIPERKVATVITPTLVLPFSASEGEAAINGDHLVLELELRKKSSSSSSCSRNSTSDFLSGQASCVSPVQRVSTGSEASDGGTSLTAM